MSRININFQSIFYLDLYPFSGVAKCAKCGHSYTGPFKKRRSRTIYRFYKCAGRCKFGICDSPVVAEESIENALLGMLELAKTELEFEDKNYYPTVDKNEIEKQYENLHHHPFRTCATALKVTFYLIEATVTK
ncbi:zinc ribbon domain-containing protein [Fervidibacillus halotolerans]|uniref:zinc ribbon domain-containing protein n=1 Tax=Fervidibacillus halotolerans TaxID=2980027 RepID=UPI003B8454E8